MVDYLLVMSFLEKGREKANLMTGEVR